MFASSMFSHASTLGFVKELTQDNTINEKSFRQFLATGPSDEFVKSLIEDAKDSIVKCVDKSYPSRTILTYFIVYGKTKWIDILFERLNEEQKNYLLQFKDRNGDTCLHVAARNERDDLVLFTKLIILYDYDAIMCVDEYGDNKLLFSAAIIGNQKILNFLLGLGFPLPRSICNALPGKIKFQYFTGNYQGVSKDEILLNIEKIRKFVLYENRVLTQITGLSILSINVETIASLFTLSVYVEAVSSLPVALINSRLSLVLNFLNQSYENWKCNLSLSLQNEIKKAVARFYAVCTWEILSEYADSKNILLAFCKLSDVMPDIVSNDQEEKLVRLLYEFRVFNDPIAVAYLKKIQDKNDLIKLMLFYHYCSESNGEYNPVLALEYGCQLFLSKDYMDTTERNLLFEKILELLKNEKKAAVAFDLARSLARSRLKAFDLYTREQSSHKFCSLILFAAKQNYEPAIQELKKIPFDCPSAYNGDYCFYRLSQDELFEIQKFLVATNNMPPPIFSTNNKFNKF